MIPNMSGYPLETAEAAISRLGFSVVKTEVRSKKGIEGGCPRVIRQCLIGENTVELCFSLCITAPKEESCDRI